MHIGGLTNTKASCNMSGNCWRRK